MEPVNIEVQTEGKMQQLHQVTPLSKYLAMALFVIMPFLGGYVGYVWAPDKVVEVERVVVIENEIEKVKEVPYVECFNSKNYFVIAPLWFVEKYPTDHSSFIVKDKQNYTDTIPCVYEVRENDLEIEKYTSVSVLYLANDKLYFDSGVSKSRGFSVYDIATEEFILRDRATGGERETSADFVRYWSVADDEMGPEDCVDIDMEEWGNWGVGLNEYVEFNYLTQEETLIEKKCARRE